MLLVANSTPMVDLVSKLNSLRVNLERRLDLPTPESPINTTNKSSLVLNASETATKHTPIQQFAQVHARR